MGTSDDAQKSTAMTVAAPKERKTQGVSKIAPQQQKSVDGGVRAAAGKKTFQQGRGGGTGTNRPATIPEYDIYSSKNKSRQAQLKRRAFLELVEVDIDRVNLEHDFAVKDARFERARAVHVLVHEQWTKTKAIFEGTSAAANVYFVAQQTAEREHLAARHDRLAAEAGVKQAEDSWAVAHGEAGQAVKVFRAKDVARTQAAAVLQAFNDERGANMGGAEARPTAMMVALAVTVSSTGESSSGDGGDLVSNHQEISSRGRKRSLPGTEDSVLPDTTSGSAAALVTINVVRQGPAAAVETRRRGARRRRMPPLHQAAFDRGGYQLRVQGGTARVVRVRT